MKQLIINTCKKLVVMEGAEMTVFIEGASNCWSVANALQILYKLIVPILDWLHIAKHFKLREFIIPEKLRKLYDKAKWYCWHGRPLTAII